MSSLTIGDVEIKDYKNVGHVTIKSQGNNVIFNGRNGVGKSNILEAIRLSFQGKASISEDPVSHGKESAVIKMTLRDGNTVRFTITTKVKADGGYSLAIKTVDDNGVAMTVNSPAEFLKKLVGELSFDPTSFRNKRSREQLIMLYNLLPDLKVSLDKIDSDIATTKAKRAQINAEITPLEVHFKNTEFVPGVPEEEIDAKTLFDELSAAQEHNRKLDPLEEALRNTVATISDNKTLEARSLEAIKITRDQIKDLEAQIDNHYKNISSLQIKTLELGKEKGRIELSISEFVPSNIESINARIAALGATNKSIQSNQRRNKLESNLAAKKKEWSDLGNSLKKLDESRASTMASVKMPIEGLAVGDGCLTFPDPRTGTIVPINNLSTGQFWSVAMAIHVALNPQLRVMFVNDIRSLDTVNRMALISAAAAHDLQLWIHETSDAQNMEIIIMSDEEKK